MNVGDSPFSNDVGIKEVPHTIDGSFTWLTKTPTHDQWAIGDRAMDELPLQLKYAIRSAEHHGCTLPQEFVTFIGEPDLHKHLRSVTACYLHLALNLLPFQDGFLLRFLHDQQDCAFWYLYLNSDGSDHCVVSSFEFFDADEMDYEIDELNESDFVVWETSFERFLSRFWIENEILFAEYDETPPPDIDEKYLRLYSSQHDS